MAITFAINPTPPTAPVGGVRSGSAGVDTAGNIWCFFPKADGGWLYAVTVTGGLPLAAGGTNVEGGGTSTP
jgi:hypothetical protein